MTTNNDSFFTEPVDPKREARFLALEVVCRLLFWMAEHSEFSFSSKASRRIGIPLSRER
jgi:hypothetical protein